MILNGLRLSRKDSECRLWMREAEWDEILDTEPLEGLEDMKDSPNYCYTHRHYQTPQYTYSMKAIDFIVDEIRKAPDRILDDLKKKSSRP